VSFAFPPGEKFFIHSVQNYQDRITDAVLKEQVKQFIYQEATLAKT
jgi:predicted metal-dependent hydrolase